MKPFKSCFEEVKTDTNASSAQSVRQVIVVNDTE